jgi:hypothetical protein
VIGFKYVLQGWPGGDLLLCMRARCMGNIRRYFRNCRSDWHL